MTNTRATLLALFETVSIYTNPEKNMAENWRGKAKEKLYRARIQLSGWTTHQSAMHSDYIPPHPYTNNGCLIGQCTCYRGGSRILKVVVHPKQLTVLGLQT